jgi:transcriptional regulator with XRE-family HTH domain
MDGGELKALRQSLGLTQEELAAQLEVHPITVWRWSNGDTTVPKWVARELKLLLTRRTRVE